ncbi:2Fe-2S iron-sulfur cluster binding domain-containing protein [Bacillus sp. sid0103]|uniref:2Fe-2S iron-sulfur cluster-binding protein n=1 Tax=Bacillus sp. sid0103 TaxID=2856337 RepID=UPI001C48E011|nr:2Fe-2S iron-sulfur cluster binding domain-containing protein [Bacillus sp. sid0103]MBV7506631.1 2Fe-2S iron-sulfur cluster binding domain-containing protein [Bacillus sp. sid0103]
MHQAAGLKSFPYPFKEDVYRYSNPLEALLEAGIKAPYSCRVGRCGTCELNVLEGEIDHYDSFLTEEQKGLQKSILACVSRAKSEEIVIDIYKNAWRSSKHFYVDRKKLTLNIFLKASNNFRPIQPQDVLLQLQENRCDRKPKGY